MHSAIGIEAFDRSRLQGKEPPQHNLPTTLHALDRPFSILDTYSLHPCFLLRQYCIPRVIEAAIAMDDSGR
jgi:hypothetical protein